MSRSQFCVNGRDFIPVQQTWGKLNLIDLRCILPTGLECLQLTRHEYGWSNQWPKPNCGSQPVGHRGHCHCFARKLYMVWLRTSASRNWTKSWAGHDLLQPLCRAFLPPVVELESWSERGLIRSWMEPWKRPGLLRCVLSGTEGEILVALFWFESWFKVAAVASS